MNTEATRNLVKISETDLMVKDPNEDIRGLEVRDREGEEIGTVSDLLLDAQGEKVRFIEVESGGFLGIGASHFLIPVDAITRIRDEMVFVNQERGHIARAPRYNPELISTDDVGDDYYEGMYRHFGYTPYWGPGYIYPAFPYY